MPTLHPYLFVAYLGASTYLIFISDHEKIPTKWTLTQKYQLYRLRLKLYIWRFLCIRNPIIHRNLETNWQKRQDWGKQANYPDSAKKIQSRKNKKSDFFEKILLLNDIETPQIHFFGVNAKNWNFRRNWYVDLEWLNVTYFHVKKRISQDFTRKYAI